MWQSASFRYSHFHSRVSNPKHAVSSTCRSLTAHSRQKDIPVLLSALNTLTHRAIPTPYTIMSAQSQNTSPAGMASYAPLTHGLKHVTKTSELQPGQVYIVRFKNALRNHRTDIWICVILPEGFEPAGNLSRRPKGARPTEEGSAWTAPLNERVYPTYLPGRNLL